jgi:hypothetical protein
MGKEVANCNKILLKARSSITVLEYIDSTQEGAVSHRAEEYDVIAICSSDVQIRTKHAVSLYVPLLLTSRSKFCSLPIDGSRKGASCAVLQNKKKIYDDGLSPHAG